MTFVHNSAESDGEELNKVKEQAICKLGELYAEQKYVPSLIHSYVCLESPR